MNAIRNAAKSRQQYMMLFNYRKTTFNPKLDKTLYAVVSVAEPLRLLEHCTGGDKPVSAPVVFTGEHAAIAYLETGRIPGTPVPAIACGLLIPGEDLFHVTMNKNM